MSHVSLPLCGPRQAGNPTSAPLLRRASLQSSSARSLPFSRGWAPSGQWCEQGWRAHEKRTNDPQSGSFERQERVYNTLPQRRWSRAAPYGALCSDAQCPSLCDPPDCPPPGSSVHGVLQARILEWVAISSSRGPSQPRDQTQVSLYFRQILYHLSHQGSPFLILVETN